jgi:hypothetical protein
MGRWIRKRFLLIAAASISSARRFILKHSEDWAYKDEYIDGDTRLEGAAWVT